MTAKILDERQRGSNAYASERMENGNKILIRMMLIPRTERIVMKVLCVVLSIQEVTDNSAAKQMNLLLTTRTAR